MRARNCAAQKRYRDRAKARARGREAALASLEAALAALELQRDALASRVATLEAALASPLDRRGVGAAPAAGEGGDFDPTAGPWSLPLPPCAAVLLPDGGPAGGPLRLTAGDLRAMTPEGYRELWGRFAAALATRLAATPPPGPHDARLTSLLEQMYGLGSFLSDVNPALRMAEATGTWGSAAGARRVDWHAIDASLALSPAQRTDRAIVRDVYARLEASLADERGAVADTLHPGEGAGASLPHPPAPAHAALVDNAARVKAGLTAAKFIVFKRVLAPAQVAAIVGAAPPGGPDVLAICDAAVRGVPPVAEWSGGGWRARAALPAGAAAAEE